MTYSESEPTQNEGLTTDAIGWAAIVSNGDMAAANFRLIEAAKKEVISIEFLMRDDEFGLMKLALLRKKAREGVPVLMHVDAFHLLVHPAIIKHLMDEKINITIFNELSLRRLMKVSFRNHSKALIIDGHWLKMGDSNTGNEYVHWGEGHHMKSIDVVIENEITDKARSFALDLVSNVLSKVPEIEIASNTAVSLQREQIRKLGTATQLVFKALQIQMDSPSHVTRPQKMLITDQELQQAQKELDQAEREYENKFKSAQKDFSSDWKKRSLTAGSLRFHCDPISDKGICQGVDAAVQRFICGAKEELTIVTPYLIVTQEMRQAIRYALANGAQVRFYTNSLKSTDNLTTQLAYEFRLQELAKLGRLEIYEYAGPDTIHAKFIVRDHVDCMIMTYNLDWRSEVMNLETAVEFSNREVTNDLLEWLDQHISKFYSVVRAGKIKKQLVDFSSPSQRVRKFLIQAIERHL